jgi:hypothetical protein
LFDRLWIATWTMLVGEFDLTDNLCWRWDSELGPSEPRIEDGWPISPDTPPAFAGHGGVLAESHVAIRLFRERACVGSKQAALGTSPDEHAGER